MFGTVVFDSGLLRGKLFSYIVADSGQMVGNALYAISVLHHVA